MMKKAMALLFLASLCACSGARSGNEVLDEAYEIQQKTIQALSEVSALFEARPAAEFDSLKQVIHELEENLFAIPGYELNLPGHEGHNHGHSQPSLTDEDILAVQKDLYQQVQSIQTTINTHD